MACTKDQDIYAMLITILEAIFVLMGKFNDWDLLVDKYIEKKVSSEEFAIRVIDYLTHKKFHECTLFALLTRQLRTRTISLNTVKKFARA